MTRSQKHCARKKHQHLVHRANNLLLTFRTVSLYLSDVDVAQLGSMHYKSQTFAHVN